MGVESLLAREVLRLSRAVAGETRAECEGLAVCRAVQLLSEMFLEDAINLNILHAGNNPFISKIKCQDLFPMC